MEGGGPALPARHAEPKARAAPASYPVYAENSDSEILAMNAAEEQVVM
jgi:hypothetical protein